MSLTVGIIGLPNVGKSTFLNALACSGAEASNYPFCTIECNRGMVPVPDQRLDRLADIINPDEVIPSAISFVDIAGLVKGASRGEGLGNKFLHHVREANVLAHVVRCFGSDDVSHVHGSIDPLRDIEIIRTELFLADISRVNGFMEKEKKVAKAKRKGERKEIDFLKWVIEKLSLEESVSPHEVSGYKKDMFDRLELLTSKPEVIVLNSGEDDPTGKGDDYRKVVEKYGSRNSFVISARIEAEIEDIPGDDREEFMRELGMDTEARLRFITKCHQLLGLIRYYTTAHRKLQAWSIQKGTTAPEAAGKIHSDMDSGFIRAEVVSFGDLAEAGSIASAREGGQLRTEGHDYVISDGDVVHFLFR